MVICLSSEQDLAARSIETSVLIEAGPGTGKTQVIAAKVSHLLRAGVASSEICILCFNEAMVPELKKRLESPQDILIKTYHGLGLLFLSEFADNGRQSPTVDPDSTRSYSLFREIAQQHSLRLDINDEIRKLDNLKSSLKIFGIPILSLSGDDGCDQADSEIDDLSSEEILSLHAFEVARLRQGIHSFTDLLYDPVRIQLSSNRPLKGPFKGIRYVIVDELQDISQIQLLLLYVLFKGCNITGVGDTNQTIYEWRGSSAKSLTELFPKYFPSCLKSLSETFRFGQVISSFANNLISHNSVRSPYKLRSAETAPETTLSLIPEDNPEIKDLCLRLSSYSKNGETVAILGREYAHLLSFCDQLLSLGLPFKILRDQESWTSSDVSTISILRAIKASEFGSLTKREIAGLVNKMLMYFKLPLSKRERESIANEFSNDTTSSCLIDAIVSRAGQRLRKRDDRLINWLHSVSTGQNTHQGRGQGVISMDCIESLLMSEEVSWCRAEENLTRIEALQRESGLQTIISLCRNSPQAIPAIFLLYMQSSHIHAATEDETTIKVMSIHKSKGLTFDHVVVCGLTQGVFPLPGLTPAQKEEERRLMFVAATRPRLSLTLVAPHDPVLLSKTYETRKVTESEMMASCFLYEGLQAQDF